MDKKKILALIACAFIWTHVHAQPIMSTNFESHNGSYQEIIGGTIVKNCADSIGDKLNNLAFWPDSYETYEEKTGPGIPIGFNFKYNDTEMNQFAIGSNFCIALGKDEVSLNPFNLYHVVGNDGNNAIGCTNMHDILGLKGSEISYLLTGNAPERCLTVQYKNIGLSSLWGDFCGKVQFQIKLYETSNKIEFIYKDWKPLAEESNLNFHTGLKGTLPDDFLFVEGEWNTPTTSNELTNQNYSLDNYPADGLTYTFTPAATCKKPSNQPTDLQLTASSINIKGKFTATDQADHYLILLSTNNQLDELPTDGSIYHVNDKLGEATVVDYTTDTKFSTPENLPLQGATPYYIYILAANAYCSYGPKYNTTDVLTGTITTLPDSPQSITAKEEEFGKIVLNTIPNASGNMVIIGMTTEYGTSEYGDIIIDGKFGIPTKDLEMGSLIEGGGKVIYKGKETNIPITGLTENTLYHFKAWSIDEQENISTTGVTANILTWGKVPYKPKFTEMPKYEAPFGWKVEGEDFRLESDYTLSCNIQQNAMGTINSLTTPWILLKEGSNRILLDYSMQVPGNWGRPGTAYNDWDERDVFALLVTKDEIKYDTVYKATSQTAMEQATIDSYNRIYAAFDKYAGEKVRIKIFWNCYRGINLKIPYFEVEEKLACDYPINLTVANIEEDYATLSWTSQGEENRWDIRYRIATTEDEEENEWIEKTDVAENPYIIKGLPTQQQIELQVRAKCSLTDQSHWSKSVFFTSGYSIPFIEDFKADELPSGWEFKTGAIGNPTEFCQGDDCNLQWEYQNSFRNKGIFLSPSGQSADEWILMPRINLGDGSVNYNLNLKIAKFFTGTSADETWQIVISKDGGKTFNETDVIKTIKQADLPTEYSDSTYTVPLTGMKGIIRPALYVKSTEGEASYSQLMQVSVEPTCPNDIANITITDITSETAKVTWDSEANEWFTFIRKAGETTKNYEQTATKEKIFSNLIPQTTYEIGITKMCGIGDTARVSIVKFTTLSTKACAQVENLSVKPDIYTAVFTWVGEAMKYNIRFRETGTEDWVYKSTTDLSYKIEGLMPETSYDYSIQSVCSDAEGDYSEYTATATFTTMKETCFPPSEISVKPTYKSAVITWIGEADTYDLDIREGAENWTTFEVSGRSKEINELLPETDYSIRMRSKCTAEHVSQWSEIVPFKTESIPTCVAPTNLNVNSITDTSAQLSWEADESNLTWDLRYRAGTATTWNNHNGLTEKTFELTNLTDNTAYIWAVKASCDEGRTSAWSVQNKFSTNTSGLNSNVSQTLNVYASNKILNIINPMHCMIKQVLLYSTNGQVLANYILNSDENVLITVRNVQQGKVIVKIVGEDWNKSYPVLIK